MNARTNGGTREDWAALRNVHRRTPWNMSTRAIEHEIANLGELARLGHERKGDADRTADLHDELARRYEPGSVIQMRMGSDAPRTVLVTERHADVKNGRPGFVGVYVNADTFRPRRGKTAGVWGYDEQITRVVQP